MQDRNGQATRARWATRVQALLGVASASALALTLAWPQWVEVFFEAEPDAGSGETEWQVSIGLLVATLAVGLRALRAGRIRRLAGEHRPGR